MKRASGCVQIHHCGFSATDMGELRHVIDEAHRAYLPSPPELALFGEWGINVEAACGTAGASSQG